MLPTTHGYQVCERYERLSVLRVDRNVLDQDKESGKIN